jgi:hypothetical protein
MSRPVSRVVDAFGRASAAILIAGAVAFVLVDLILTIWFP